MLTGSGVDEAWATGTQLGEAVIELLRAGKPFTQENLAATYEKRRRASWVEQGAREAENARNGFQDGIVKGMIGMALAGLDPRKTFAEREDSRRRTSRFGPFSSIARRPATEAGRRAGHRRWAHASTMRCSRRAAGRRFPSTAACWSRSRTRCCSAARCRRCPALPIMSSSAILNLCIACGEKTCVAMCSGQAITQGEDGAPAFEREKCVHCGACLWNCGHSPDGEHSQHRVPRRLRRPAFGGKLSLPRAIKIDSKGNLPMANVLHIVVCAGIVPDPLQTLEPVTAPAGPGLKNEMVLPAVLDPWAASALYEAAALVAKNPGSKLWLVSLGPKAKLQQVMMTVAQKVAFELVPIDGPIGGFPGCARDGGCAGRDHRRDARPRPGQAVALRRLGVGDARRGRDAATGRRAAGHQRPVPGRGPD